MKYIVVVYGYTDAIKAAIHIGPFDTADKAWKWAEDNETKGQSWIVRELVKGD